jgi:hypothetical protein
MRLRARALDVTERDETIIVVKPRRLRVIDDVKNVARTRVPAT